MAEGDTGRVGDVGFFGAPDTPPSPSTGPSTGPKTTPTSSEERIAARQRVVAEQQAAGLGASIRQQVVGQLVQRKQARTTAQQIQAQQRQPQSFRRQDQFQQQPGQVFRDVAAGGRAPARVPDRPLGFVGRVSSGFRRAEEFVAEKVTRKIFTPEAAARVERAKEQAPLRGFIRRKLRKTERGKKVLAEVGGIQRGVVGFVREKPLQAAAEVGLTFVGGAVVGAGAQALRPTTIRVAAKIPKIAKGARLGAKALPALFIGTRAAQVGGLTFERPEGGGVKTFRPTFKKITAEKRGEIIARTGLEIVGFRAGAKAGARLGKRLITSKITTAGVKVGAKPVARAVVKGPTRRAVTRFKAGEEVRFKAQTPLGKAFKRKPQEFLVRTKGVSDVITATGKRGKPAIGFQKRQIDIFKSTPKSQLQVIEPRTGRAEPLLGQRIAVGRGRGKKVVVSNGFFKGKFKGRVDILGGKRVRPKARQLGAVITKTKTTADIITQTRVGGKVLRGEQRLFFKQFQVGDKPLTGFLGKGVEKAVKVSKAPSRLKLPDIFTPTKAPRQIGIKRPGKVTPTTRLKVLTRITEAKGFGKPSSALTKLQRQQVFGGLPRPRSTPTRVKVIPRTLATAPTTGFGKAALQDILTPTTTRVPTQLRPVFPISTIRTPITRLTQRTSIPTGRVVEPQQFQISGEKLGVGIKVRPLEKIKQTRRGALGIATAVKPIQAIIPKVTTRVTEVTKTTTVPKITHFENFFRPGPTPTFQGLDFPRPGRVPGPLPLLKPATALFGRGRGRGRRALRQPTRFQTSFTGSSLRITAKKKPRLGGALAIRPIITSGSLFKKAVKKKTKKRKKGKKKSKK